MSKEDIIKLRQIFDDINANAERLSSFDLWDEQTMDKINKAETYLRNAMVEIIEITGVDNQQTR